MNNKNIFIAIFLLWFFLTVTTLKVGYENHLWREFWVTQAQLASSAAALCWLLKKKEAK